VTATSEDQTAAGGGWDDDSWDDEENWGDMEVNHSFVPNLDRLISHE
jgi:hypothetical protein